MKLTWGILLILGVSAAACQPSAEEIGSIIQLTQSEWTVAPTQTAYPTYTPYPTHTIYPTYTPISMPLTPTPTLNKMKIIPAGAFLMGCDPWDSRSPCLDSEAPSHIVYLKRFAIDVFEVNNKQYADCVTADACRPPKFGESDLQAAKYENQAFNDFPITNINWYDARDYCGWVGKRLPSEAEWEKAARGDQDERFYPWGDRTPDCSLVNFAGLDGNCPGSTTAVDEFPAGASPYGILNLAGNVREWVADWFDANYYLNDVVNNPPGPQTGWERSIRGGSYNSDWIDIRVNARGHNPPEFRAENLGFRCASDP